MSAEPGVAAAPPAAACAAAVPLGSARQLAAPIVDDKLDPKAALTAWRDELELRYRSCGLAPFEGRTVDLGERGTAYAHELGRNVGRYRLKPEGKAPTGADRGIEILVIEVRGLVPGLSTLLAPLRALRPWPLKTSGELVTGCRLELVEARRAELCVDLDGYDRGAPNVTSTQVHAVVLCPTPLPADEVALVWLSPAAPPPMNVVRAERAPQAALAASFTTDEPGTRELMCSEGRKWCVSLTDQGGLALTHDEEAVAVRPAELDGFALVGAPGGWRGVEHTPSGVRIARSAIGSFHGLPSAGQTRWWLAGGDCMLWRLRVPGPKKYPARLELSSLCIVEGAWVEGLHAVAPLRGEPRHVAQSCLADNIATRCRYTE